MNIILNGGTRGIGKDIALILSSDKENRILVTGRNKSSLRALVKGAVNKNIIIFQTDLEKFDEDSDEFGRFIKENLKNVDLLINNAGTLIAKEFRSFTSHEARVLLETNFLGPATMIKVTEPFMAGGAHIVNISSMGGFQGSSKYKGMSYYSASKAALACLTESLAVEFSDRGIIINCLALGSVQTEMLAEAFPGYKAPVEAKEMAKFIVDFAMNGSRYFNGKILPVALTNP